MSSVLLFLAEDMDDDVINHVIEQNPNIEIDNFTSLLESNIDLPKSTALVFRNFIPSEMISEINISTNEQWKRSVSYHKIEYLGYEQEISPFLEVFSEICTIQKAEKIILFESKNHVKPRSHKKSCIYVSISQSVILKFKWYMGVQEVSEEILLILNPGDVCLLPNYSSGSKNLLKTGIRLKTSIFPN